MGLDELSPLEDLPEEVEAEIDGDANICGYEVLHAPVGAAILVVCEDGEAIEDDDNDEEHQSDVGGVGLEAGFEDEVGVAVDVLGNEGFAESKVGDEDADPCEERRNCSKGLEPVEDGGGPRRNSHEGEKADTGSNQDALHKVLADVCHEAMRMILSIPKSVHHFWCSKAIALGLVHFVLKRRGNEIQ